MQTKHRNSTSALAEHAQTAVDEIQSTGAAVIDRAKNIYQTAQNGVVTGARTADKAIRKNPYQAIGVAFGVGLLAGFLIRRRK
jgi:ElaB/YqjD/DUF883 family membrane-anchored ribosome-binding protein